MTASKIREGSDDSHLPTMAARCSFCSLTEEGFLLLKRSSDGSFNIFGWFVRIEIVPCK